MSARIDCSAAAHESVVSTRSSSWFAFPLRLSCASFHHFLSLLVFLIPVFQVLWISSARFVGFAKARDYWAVTKNRGVFGNYAHILLFSMHPAIIMLLTCGIGGTKVMCTIAFASKEDHSKICHANRFTIRCENWLICINNLSFAVTEYTVCCIGFI